MTWGGFEEYGIYSDLALERMRAPQNTRGVSFTKETKMLGCGIEITKERIKISSDEGAAEIGRPKGSYDTVSMPRMDRLMPDEISEVAKEIAIELMHTAARLGVRAKRILAIGLGNSSLTPDSIGPRAASGINATLHISKYECELFEKMECSEIAVIAPGVTSDSGIEAGRIASAVSKMLSPDAVIAIDSLAARSQSRLGSTVQISDTGIFPGSGMGKGRLPINEKTVGAPVIAIGIPTVISASLLSSAGCEGESFCGMFVAPGEIDGIVKNGSAIISRAINLAFGIV